MRYLSNVYIYFFQAQRIFNTWVGDPSKVVLLEAVVKVIKEQNLLARVNDTGNYLFDGLRGLQVNWIGK